MKHKAPKTRKLKIEVIAPPTHDEPSSVPSREKKQTGAGRVWRIAVAAVSAAVFLFSMTMLIYESVYVPATYTADMEDIREIYRPSASTDSNKPSDTGEGDANTDTSADTEEDESPHLDDLRAINGDTVGWLTFQSTGEKTVVDIDYPVLQTDDNDYYLNHDFRKKKNKTGCLFLDYRNQVTPKQDQSMVIYGHNLSTGLMFATLNRLVNNLYHARLATSMTFTTDNGTAEYKVFSVMVLNAEPEQGPIFNYMKQSFPSEEESAAFIEELRKRSMYDYSVDVHADDELLLLSTCVPRSWTKYKGARTVVAARKLRDGERNDEKITVNTNKDCLYPLVYYTSQRLPIPKEYTNYTTTKKTTTTTTATVTQAVS